MTFVSRLMCLIALLLHWMFPYLQQDNLTVQYSTVKDWMSTRQRCTRKSAVSNPPPEFASNQIKFTQLHSDSACMLVLKFCSNNRHKTTNIEI